MESTVRVPAGEPLDPHLENGATVTLGAGTHGPLDLAVTVHLTGEPGARIDAGGRGPALRVGEYEREIVVEGVEITGGDHELGAGVLIEAWSDVRLRDCTIRGNRRGAGGGAGLGVRRGLVTVERCTFGPDDDVVITSVADVTFRDTVIHGDVHVLEGAKVRFAGGEIRGRLVIRGTESRSPSVHLAGTAVGAIVNDDAQPGQVSRS